MEDFSSSQLVNRLDPGMHVYPGDVILSVETMKDDQVLIHQYTATNTGEVNDRAKAVFYLVSRGMLGEPRSFGTIVRNSRGEEFVFTGDIWRRENGRPTTWDAIAEGAPIEVVRNGLRG